MKLLSIYYAQQKSGLSFGGEKEDCPIIVPMHF